LRRDFPQKNKKKQDKSAASAKKADGAALLAQSPYLQGLAARLPDVLELPAEDAFQEALSAATKALNADIDIDDVMRVLRQAKQKIALITAHADLTQAWDDLTVMQKLSDFADFAVTTALRFLLTAAQQQQTIRMQASKKIDQSCGASIIALGKWGAGELNYSSDIDLMIIFDPQKSPVKNKDETQNFFIRLTRDLAKIMELPTADGYVFRCDLRLRPDPGAMPLAVSIATAETYYGSLGQNWERAAMIKARPVAGDTRVGYDFKQLMSAWIWRRNLDFASIQDIHSIKRQINAKHNTARKPKAGHNPYLGVNIKLGHGGIREIEFFAQTQQLIFGGRDMTLRTPQTLAALAALSNAAHIKPAEYQALHNAYLFLRRIEHRLQMIDDQQTHSLPPQPDDFKRTAHFMGYNKEQALIEDLDRHMGVVKKLYGRLFTESESLSSAGNLVFTGVEDDPETLQTLQQMGFGRPATITTAIRSWHHGRYRAVRSERARQILTEITPHLLKTLGTTPHPDDAFIRFDRFLEKLPSGIPIFSMFAKNPAQLELVADIMGTAPALADWLGTHPQVLDGVFSRDFFGSLPDLPYLKEQLSQLLAAARDYQDILDLTRRFAREKRFHAGIHILKNLSSARDCARYLSNIAEAALTVLTPHVEQDFARLHGVFKTGEFILLGMGSFAARTMFTDSDLDLIALYKTDKNEPKSNGTKPLTPSVYYIRLMQRLITALSAPTAESTLYEVDSRLRPAGDDGPLAIGFDAFFDYQKNKAWTWEHMCLIRSRVVYATPKTTKNFQQNVQKILSAKRDPEKICQDICAMQAKVQKQYGTKDPWQMKYRAGGVMDMMFALHYLILRHGHSHIGLHHACFADAIAALKTAKLLGAKEAASLQKTADMAVAAQAFLRLTAELPFSAQKATDGLKQQLAAHLFPTQKKITYTQALRQSAGLFQDSAALCKKILSPVKPKPPRKKTSGKK